jgi:hypothetical protein
MLYTITLILYHKNAWIEYESSLPDIASSTRNISVHVNHLPISHDLLTFVHSGLIVFLIRQGNWGSWRFFIKTIDSCLHFLTLCYDRRCFLSATEMFREHCHHDFSLSVLRLDIMFSRHYVMKFVSHLWQVCGFPWVLRFPPPITLNITI